MEVILDSSFILSCVKKKIDFVAQLEEQGFKIVVPREVLQEMKDLKLKSGLSHEERSSIDFIFKIVESEKIKKISLGSRKVDMGLIEKGREGIYIATLDRAIKREVKNKVIIFDAQKKVGIGND